MDDCTSGSDLWLADAAALVCIAASRFGAPLPLSYTMGLVELWRTRNWPIVHFLPDPGLEQRSAPETALVQPGSLWFESDTASIWSCPRFREYHRDQGAPSIVIVGGDLDRSVIAVAAGAAERRAPAIFLPDTAGVTFKPPNDKTARQQTISIVRHFALEASPERILKVLTASSNLRRRY
jgi:hypothetical protein